MEYAAILLALSVFAIYIAAKGDELYTPQLASQQPAVATSAEPDAPGRPASYPFVNDYAAVPSPAVSYGGSSTPDPSGRVSGQELRAQLELLQYGIM